jgi:hypothetical protein
MMLVASWILGGVQLAAIRRGKAPPAPEGDWQDRGRRDQVLGDAIRSVPGGRAEERSDRHQRRLPQMTQCPTPPKGRIGQSHQRKPKRHLTTIIPLRQPLLASLRYHRKTKSADPGAMTRYFYTTAWIIFLSCFTT